ncbi:hypothetical protein MA16_Dca011356 [Dendrobium catenatum]|uniref:Uncharacterized protein n=1 Tax=Dendrobium catenatum TaxID=906689 RepID=A0A2I0WNZ2_9ASPA|nr:hypothetical protein MA16_Dca011356 [Dendrobium catenatum]
MKEVVRQSEDGEFPSSNRGGIARRVQLRNDRKRKKVKTPFTLGDRKKKRSQSTFVHLAILAVEEISG